MLARTLMVTCFALVGAGCYANGPTRPVSFIPIGQRFRVRPRPMDTVAVYTVRPPERPFVEAGVLVAERDQEALQWGAAQLGCSAIFLLPPETKVHSSHLGFTTKLYDVYSTSTYRATCLVYTDEAPASPNAKDPFPNPSY